MSEEKKPAELPPEMFADDTGEAWALRINYAQKNKLKPLGLDVCALPSVEFEPLDSFVSNADTLMPALRMLLADQLRERNVTAEQFDERMSWQSIDSARRAFVYVVLGFFPEPLRSAARAMAAKGEENATAMVERLLAESEGEFRPMPNTSINSAGNTPASSEESTATTTA